MATLTFFYSTMNAGKSTHLLQDAHGYSEGGGNALLFTSALDNRAGVGRISSRIGIASDAYPLRQGEDLFNIVERSIAIAPVAAVLIDEVQFLDPEHVHQAVRIVDELGVPVRAYGIKNNSFGTLFGPAVIALMAVADSIREIERLCHCGSKATMILRYDHAGRAVKSGGDVVEIGGEDRYISVCRPHWTKGDIGPMRRSALAAELAAA